VRATISWSSSEKSVVVFFFPSAHCLARFFAFFHSLPPRLLYH